MNLTSQPSANGNQILDDLLEEIAAAVQSGQSVDLEAYVARYPEQAEQIRRLFPAIQALAELGADIEEDRASEPGREIAAGPNRPRVLGDYRILREVGRGGMGVVYEAEQISLARRVALKVLPYAAVLDPRALQRFKNEALAAAALDHPNIVELYGVGCERGVHFYAMRYVDGPSLADCIRQMQARQQSENGHRYQSLAEVIADSTVNSAHIGSTGDEPTAAYCGENEKLIVACPNGETSRSARPARRAKRSTSVHGPGFYRSVAELAAQVAEALQHAHESGVIHRDVKPSNLLIDGRGKVRLSDFGLARIEAGSAMTATGDLLGTLRYMSPEQALANRVLVDHRTDIYSLGATLYELLTLDPVFEGENRQELLRQISFNEPRRPRRIEPSIPAELETIVLKALEKNPAHRYGTAQDLAEDLCRFVEDKPIQARRPGLRQRVAKWSRRHRPEVAAAVACVLMLIVAAGGSLGWTIRDHAAHAATIETEVRLALREALRLEGAQKFPEALTIAERARGLANSGSHVAALAAEIDATLRDLALVNQLESACMLKVEIEPSEIDTQPERALPAYEAAFREYGIVVLQTRTSRAAGVILKRPSAIQSAIVAALDDWIAVEREFGHRAKSSPRRLEWLEDLVAKSDQDMWRNAIRLADKRRQWKKLLDLARDTRAGHQDPRAVLLLGAVLCQNDQTRQQGIDLLRHAQLQSPADFRVNLQLFVQVIGDKREPEEALRFATACAAVRADHPSALFNLSLAFWACGRHKDAFATQQRVVQLRPRWAIAHHNLGVFYHHGEGKQFDKAILEYRRAIELAPELAEGHSGLGVALQDKGQLDEAIVEHRRAIELAPDFAEARNNLGVALKDKGQLDEAIVEQRRAIELKPDYAEAHSNLGNALRDKGQWDEAIAEQRRAIELKPDFAEAHNSLGIALGDKGQLDEAIAEFRRAIELKPDYAEAHSNLGVALKDKGQLDEAIAESRRAIELKPDYAEAHSNLGNALRDKGQWDEAIAESRRAIELKPDFAGAHNSLGVALYDKGQWDEAIAESRRAIELKPDFAEAHNSLGVALYDKGQLDEAIAEFHRAIELKPDYAEAHSNLGNALRDKGQWDEAIAEFRRAIELKPTSGGAHGNLGIALHDKGHFGEAIAEYRRAIELKPDLLEAHFNLGLALRDKGQLDEAIAEFRRAIELKPDFAEAHNSLGVALYDKGQLDEAIAEFRRSVELKPGLHEAHSNLGNALRDKGQWDEAIVEYRRAIELNPDDPESHFHLGVALGQKDLLAAAIAEYRRAIELKPDFAEAHVNLGVDLAAKDQLHEAIAAYRRAIELKPAMADAYNNLAWLLATSIDPMFDNMREAVELSTKAVQLAPAEGAAWNTLGVVQYRAAHWHEATTALTKSMELKKGGSSTEWFFLAMAQWQVGNKDDARAWYDKAVEWMDTNAPQDEELVRFRAEAATLLRVAGEPTPEAEAPAATKPDPKGG